MIINGPNMNMLGIREPDIYGKKTYSELCDYIKDEAYALGTDVTFFQSNHEGDLVDAVQRAYFEKYDGIIINPAAYTHTSIALRDAVAAVNIPTAEVHLSDISEREDFRRTSPISDVCTLTVKGLGFEGYKEAMTKLKKYILNI